MKKFNLFKMLAVLIVLITSINTTWASGGSEGTSITVYTIGCYFSKDDVTWDYANSAIRIDVRRDGNNWADYGTHIIWNAKMTNTGKTYLGFPIYSYTFKEYYDGAQIRFKHYKSGAAKEDYDTGWTGTTTMNGKLYLGFWGIHNWVDYDDNIRPIYLDMNQASDDWTSSSAVFKMNDGSKTVWGVKVKDKLYAFSSCKTNITNLKFYRCNPDGLGTWNSDESVTYSSDYNTYKVVSWNEVQCANDNINLVNKTTRVYFDNSYLGISETNKYFIIGHDNFSGYSKCYNATRVVGNTKLLYYEISSDVWRDATYYGFVGNGTSWGDGSWGSSNLKNATKRTGAYKNQFDLAAGHVTLFYTSESGNDKALGVTYKGTNSSSLNTTQTIKYALSTNGGSTYTDMSSGNTPGQISISAYKFVDDTYNSVSNSENTATISSNTSGTYSTNVYAAYTGETTLTANARSGYTFVDWDGASSPLYPKAEATYTARYKANQYTLSFNDEGATTAGGNSNRTVTFEQSTNLGSVTCPKKEGYTFNGYWTTASGDGVQVFAANGSLISTASGYTSSGKWVYYSGNVTLHARWTDDGIYYFHGGASGTNTAWATASNWTKGVVPGSTSDVIILKPVVVTAGTTKTVNSVKIATSGFYTPNGGSAITAGGKLTIPAEAMLVVTTNVQNCIISANAAASPTSTTAATLHIEAGNTTTDGNGALVWGTSGTPGYATVDFCTKSHGENSANDINQYIGTPFSNNPTMLSQYYNSWMYKIVYTDGVPDWSRITGDATLNDFEGYNLITAYDAGTTYSMQGQLASNADVTLNTSSTPALYYNGSSNTENVLANSWVAPILINNFEDADFTRVEKSIYIFNAGSPKQAETAKAGEAGNYTAYSIATIKEAGTNVVIPSMQSFSVYTSGASPSLTLDYSDLVQANASNSLIEPNLAPKRYTNDKMDLLKVRVEGDNGWADELKVYIREDFSTDFEDGWDAHKMYGYPQAPQLYAVTTDGAMAINCVPTAENNVIGFIPGSKDDEYTFSFEYDGNEDLYLKDNKTGIETPINEESSYSFTASKSDGDMRFVTIKKSPAIVTGIDELNVQDLSVQKILHNGALYIIRDGRIYNAEGMLIK